MDFYNMLDEERLEDKRVSKTSAVLAMIPYVVPMRIGPSDYVNFLHNDKYSIAMINSISCLDKIAKCWIDITDLAKPTYMLK